MQSRNLEVTAESSAAPEAVWALLADVTTWSRWAAFDESGLERPGSGDPQGVGAIRRFRRGRYHNREEVVRFEAPHALSYEVRAGNIPVHDYHADVVLQERLEGGTIITWRSSFDARWPLAPLIERGLRSFIADTAVRLAATAEADDHQPTGPALKTAAPGSTSTLGMT
jgi:uncharacterized protein YndB with AHSA1/START domain